jgi:hypothetical protein
MNIDTVLILVVNVNVELGQKIVSFLYSTNMDIVLELSNME